MFVNVCLFYVFICAPFVGFTRRLSVFPLFGFMFLDSEWNREDYVLTRILFYKIISQLLK